MTQKKKLVLGPLPEQLDDYSKYEESVTRWDRIIMAFVVIAAAIGVIVYSLLADDEPNHVDSMQNQPELSAEAIDRDAEKAPESLVGTELHNQKINNETGNKESEGKDSISTARIVQSLDTPKANETELKKSKAITPVITSPTQKPIQTKPSSPLPEQTQASENVLMTAKPAVVSIKQNTISRAVLTQELKEKEPVSMLPYTVELPPEGIIKVMLFTEMNGLRGTTLYHEWYRNEVRQARVKIPVNVRQQRSHSSKYINTQMTGEWQVRVVDDKSKVYVEAGFSVTNP